MIRSLRHFVQNCSGAAAVEAAIFLPIFLVMTLGITDLGAGMFVRMQVNAAAQAGAAYAVIHYGSATNQGICYSGPSGACLSGILAAMNDATGNPSFCTTSVCPTPTFAVCADANGGVCYSVTANYPYTPILPDAVYAWALDQTYSST